MDGSGPPRKGSFSMARSYKPGKGYSKKDWDAVSGNPKLTAEQISKARPFAEALPELAASIRRGRGPNKAPTKKLVGRISRRRNPPLHPK
jgi:hypothetical protein